MPLILVTALLLVFAVGSMQYTKKSFGVCLSASVLGIILITYVCAITNTLWVSVFLLRGLFAVNLLVCFYHLVQVLRKKQPWNIPVIDSAVFAALMCGLWFLVRGRMYSDWDEFSFWGTAFKFSFYNDTLYTSNLFDNLFKSYPPAQILLQYGVMKTLGIGFREDVAILLASVPVVSVAMYPTSFFIKEKKYITAFAASILLMLSPTILETTAYTKTIVDLKLGVVMAFLILVAMLPESKRTKIVLLCLGGAVLSLYKTTGVGLACLTLIACAICFIVQERQALKEASYKKKAQIILINFLPVVSALVANMTWKYHIAAKEVFVKWNETAAFSDIFGVLTGHMPEYRVTVLQNFAKQFFADFSQGMLVKFSPVVWAIICVAAIALAAAVINKPCKKAIWCGGIVSVCVFVVFSISLLYSYLFVFEEIEATGLASFYRYLNSGILAMIMVAFVALLWAGAQADKPAVKIALCVPCVLLILNSMGFYGFCDILKAPAVAAAQTHHDRYLYIRTARYIRQLGENPRLYLITANDSGWTQMLVNYELLPDIVLPQQYTMLSAHEHDDPTVHTISAEDWGKLLYEQYDYVYIHCPEPQFVADYLSLFEDESQVVVDRMFEVIRQPDGTVKLRRIEMVPEDGYVS